ncbi:hypothetical protein GCM10007108_14090 [Thermogymnomonas acidicola]|uniref:Uncharacterized protein n=1 Tax=Thermogymnomonas acidicola TaxID=399579 RepID=A0AA37F9S7_9ARCH|nr:hypothetical protein [Thermogymnomonas acidicola]GGM77169.1 hypothetical protein GCM10007108_14090 [Thermogymnomonas acidicola]
MGIDKIAGLNNVPTARGIGEFAGRMQAILGKNVVSLVTDKRYWDMDYPGEKV